MDYRWIRWLSLVTNTLISYWSPSWKSRLTFWPGFWPITSAVKLLSPRLFCWAELFAWLYNSYLQVNTNSFLKFLTCNLQRYEYFWLITKKMLNIDTLTFYYLFQIHWTFYHWFCTWAGNGALRCPSRRFTFIQRNCFPQTWDTPSLEFAAWLAAWGQYCHRKLLFWWVDYRKNVHRGDRYGPLVDCLHTTSNNMAKILYLYIPFIFCVTLFIALWNRYIDWLIIIHSGDIIFFIFQLKCYIVHDSVSKNNCHRIVSFFFFFFFDLFT